MGWRVFYGRAKAIKPETLVEKSNCVRKKSEAEAQWKLQNPLTPAGVLIHLRSVIDAEFWDSLIMHDVDSAVILVVLSAIASRRPLIYLSHSLTSP